VFWCPFNFFETSSISRTEIVLSLYRFIARNREEDIKEIKKNKKRIFSHKAKPLNDCTH
jgi:hypothetical protein